MAAPSTTGFSLVRSKSSRKWLKEHFDDEYVREAQKQGLRSRAAFKLMELQEKYSLVRSGHVVVDLGAAPGGWSQVAADWVGDRGSVIALDILPMDALAGVTIIEGDFTEDAPLQQLTEALDGRLVNLVLSDMAPNISGMKAVDQPRAMYLAELALDFAVQHLERNGVFLVKLFQGAGFDEYLRDCRSTFGSVKMVKPKASRPRSQETYLLGRGLKVNS